MQKIFRMEVNVADILHKKNPTLARLMPEFALDYLRRIVHETQINYYLRNFSTLSSIEFVRATLQQMQISYNAVGMEKLDPKGRYIFASNHPFGGLDGLMLADEVCHYFGDVRVVVNDILMNLTPISSLFIPINKHGRQNSDYLRIYNDAFESSMPIITFPAGLCSRRKGGVIADAHWKHNFVKRAIATNRDIVPVHFEGELSRFFYRLSNIRSRLGIRANIEMLYLADEMFAQKGKHFEIIIGNPIACSSLSDGHSASYWAKAIRTQSYNLRNHKQDTTTNCPPTEKNKK